MSTPEAVDGRLIRFSATLSAGRVDIVFLAGYLKRLGPATLAAFRGRVLNTHPALLPRFGGQGMFGDRVRFTTVAIVVDRLAVNRIRLTKGDGFHVNRKQQGRRPPLPRRPQRR